MIFCGGEVVDKKALKGYAGSCGLLFDRVKKNGGDKKAVIF
jgi:hypothetical protein